MWTFPRRWTQVWNFVACVWNFCRVCPSKLMWIPEPGDWFTSDFWRSPTQSTSSLEKMKFLITSRKTSIFEVRPMNWHSDLSSSVLKLHRKEKLFQSNHFDVWLKFRKFRFFKKFLSEISEKLQKSNNWLFLKLYFFS